MFKQRKIGIDLGKNSIRMISFIDMNIKDNYNSPVINREYFIKYNNDDEYIEELKKSITHFTSLFEERFFSLNFIIPHDNRTIVEYMTMPNVEDKIIEKSISVEINNLGKRNLEDYQLEWVKIGDLETEIEGTDDKLEEVEIMLIGMEKEFIEKLNDMGNVFWSVNKIQPQIISLGQFVDETDVMILDLGFESSRIFGYKDFKPVGVKHVDYSDLGFNIDIDEEPIEKIDKIKAIKSFSFSRDNADESVCSSSMEKIITKIKDAVRETETQQGLLVDKIYVHGGILNLSNFKKILEDELAIKIEELNLSSGIILENNPKENEDDEQEVEDENFDEDEMEIPDLFISDEETDDEYVEEDIGDLFDEIEENTDEETISDLEDPFDDNFLAEEIIEEVDDVEDEDDVENEYKLGDNVFNDKTTYMCALSVIVDRNSIPVNFSTNKKINIELKSVLLGALSAIFVVFIGLVIMTNKYDKNINLANNELSDIQHQYEEVSSEQNDLENQINQYEERIRLVDSIKDQKVWLSDILYTLASDTPNGVAIEEIDIMQGTAVLNGYAKDYSNVGYIVIALEKYGDVEIYEIDNNDQDIKGKNNLSLEKKFRIELKHNGSVVNDDIFFPNDNDAEVVEG